MDDLGRRVAISGRPNILIASKEILRVVLALQGGEPRVVDAVARPDPFFAFVTQVADVSAARGLGLQAGPQFVGPLDVGGRFSRFRPHRHDDGFVVRVAVREGGSVRGDAADGASQVLDQDARKRRFGVAIAFHQRIDHLVAELVEEARLPMVEPTVRKTLVNHRLRAGVGHGLKHVHQRRPKAFNGASSFSAAFAGPTWHARMAAIGWPIRRLQ